MADKNMHDRWKRVRENNGIDQVIETNPNGEIHTTRGTRVHGDRKAHVRVQRQGSYVVCTVSGAQYIILETDTPAGRVRHLYTTLSPEELERRGHL